MINVPREKHSYGGTAKDALVSAKLGPRADAMYSAGYDAERLMEGSVQGVEGVGLGPSAAVKAAPSDLRGEKRRGDAVRQLGRGVAQRPSMSFPRGPVRSLFHLWMRR